MRKYTLLAVLLGVVAILAACDSANKTASEAAIKTAETALAPIAGEAQKYVPDQAKAVQDSLQQAKADIANGDYGAALDVAKGLPSKVSDLAEALKAKKEELTAKWNDLSNSMPGLVSAVQTRFDTLKRAHKLPTGANEGVTDLTHMWSDASTSFQSGDLQAAMEKASAAKEKLAEVQKMLGMKVSS